jgi:hypothetical protein
MILYNVLNSSPHSEIFWNSLTFFSTSNVMSGQEKKLSDDDLGVKYVVKIERWMDNGGSRFHGQTTPTS